MKKIGIIGFFVDDLNLQINNFLNNFYFENLNHQFIFYIFTNKIDYCKNTFCSLNPLSFNINFIYYPHNIKPFYLFNQYQFIEDLLNNLEDDLNSIYLFNPTSLLNKKEFLNIISDSNKLILNKSEFNNNNNTENNISFGGDFNKFKSFISCFTMILSKEKEKENYFININNLFCALLISPNFHINNNIIKKIRNDIYNINFERIKYESPKLIIKTNGGFGNNLFQVFCGLSLAYKFNRIPYLVYDSNYIDNIKKTGNTYRPSIHKYYLLDKIQKIELSHLEKLQKNIYKENGFNYNLDINNFFINNQNSDIIELEGYFQSTFYFREFFHKIYNDLFLKLKFDVINSFKKEQNYTYVGIHIRGGDYLKHKDFHLNLSSSYYLNILNNHLDYNNTTKNKDFKFIIFTDDKHHALSLNLFNENHNFIFASDFINCNPNIKSSSYKHLDEFELFLFGQMDIMICANSSFALWSSYLSDSQKIFIPNKWFVPNDPFVDIPQLTLNNKYNIINYY